MAASRGGGRFRAKVASLGVCLLLLYNLNGREIGSYDSQPTKMLAREIVLGAGLTLDSPVAAQPALAERPGFAKDLHGHYRSAYPVAPALMAASLLAFADAAGLVNARAPLAHDLAAKATASLLVTLAVVLLTSCARRWTRTDRTALLVGAGLGLGTNYWALASQTLWQHETVAFGLALALWAIARPDRAASLGEMGLGALGLALAAGARLQTVPAIAVLMAWLWLTRRHWSTLVALSPVALVISALMLLNWHWFGHPLGAVPRLEALHPAVHGVSGSWSPAPWVGLAGLLVSPNRGLMVFSPVVVVAGLGLRRAWRDGRPGILGWLAAAACCQWLVYGVYSVWWGGFTYGPRYVLDMLPWLVPLAAAGLGEFDYGVASRLAGLLTLTWSVGVAGVGAFCYPNERWNTTPSNVDLNHSRLWDWHDLQIVRAARAGPSPRNFTLLERAAVR